METLRRAVTQAVHHGLIPPPQRGVLERGFQEWEAAGRPPQAPDAWLVGLGLQPAEVEQLMLWRSHQASSKVGSGSQQLRKSDSAKYGGSSLARYLRAGPLAKASKAQGARLGPYVVDRELARGGMGVVFVAHQEPSGRKVALKTMILGAQASEESKARFTREAETAARLDHPGLVKVLGAGEEDGLAWLALEFIEGETLAEAIKAGGTRRLVKLLAAAARALGHAHRAGVIHRDIKPQNILVDPQVDRVVVTDFGLVKDLEKSSDLTKTGQALGTPYYMAPEQVVGEQPTPATDVYALGVILYEVLSGVIPFAGEQGLRLFAAIKNEAPTALEVHDPHVSPGLASICRLAMSKDPAARYPTADGLADDLEAWLRGEGGAPASPRGPLIPLLVGGVAVLVVLLGLLLQRRTPPQVAAPSEAASPTARPSPGPSPEPSEEPAGAPTPTATPTETPTQAPAGGAGVDRAEAIRRAEALLAKIRGRAGGAKELALAEQAVAVAPFFGKARWYRGRLLAARKEVKRALSDLRAADKVAIPFTGPGLYDLRGKLLYDTRSFAEALPDMQRSLRRRPRDRQLAFSYALCLRAARRTEEAILAFERILKLEGRRAGWQVHYNLAGCYMEAERLDDAARTYRAVIKSLDYVHAYRNLGTVLIKQGKAEEADRMFASAAGRHGKHPGFVRVWAETRLALERWQGAEDLARRWIALEPVPGAYHLLARALIGQGRRGDAVGVLRGAPAAVRDHAVIKKLLAELGGG